MKKVLIPAVIFLALLLSTSVRPKTVFAQATPASYVAGLAVKPDYTMLNGGNVAVYCLHNGAYNTQTTTTNSQGYFIVNYYNEDCVIGDHVWVTAGLESLNGIEDADVVQSNGVGLATVIVYVTLQDPQSPPPPPEPPIIPEFGFITGILTLAASSGCFILLRRK